MGTIKVSLEHPSAAMLEMVWQAASVLAVEDGAAVVAKWQPIVFSLHFARPYPAVERGSSITLEIELGDEVDDQAEATFERWLWSHCHGQAESGYLYRPYPPYNRYFRVCYPIDTEDFERWGDPLSDDSLSTTCEASSNDAQGSPHDRFTLQQALDHLRSERGSDYRRARRDWIASAGALPEPSEPEPPAGAEITRMAAFYGCRCELCQKWLDDEQAARHEQIEFGQMVAATPSWMCLLQARRKGCNWVARARLLARMAATASALMAIRPWSRSRLRVVLPAPVVSRIAYICSWCVIVASSHDQMTMHLRVQPTISS